LKATAQRRFQAAVKSLTLIRKTLPNNMPLGTPTSTAIPVFDVLRSGLAGHNGNGHSKARLNGSAASRDAAENVIPINRIQRFATKASDLVDADKN
jgi:hypothetical protein